MQSPQGIHRAEGAVELIPQDGWRGIFGKAGFDAIRMFMVAKP